MTTRMIGAGAGVERKESKGGRGKKGRHQGYHAQDQGHSQTHQGDNDILKHAVATAVAVVTAGRFLQVVVVVVGCWF